MQTEQWKTLVDHPSYKISNKGRVKSLKWKKERVLRPTLDKGGKYLQIGIDGKKRRIHRLVALYFVHNPDPQNKIQVNHKDGDKHNNTMENLEWVTSKENTRHAVELGLTLQGENHPRCRFTTNQINEIRQRYKGRGKGPSMSTLAKEYKTNSSVIHRIVHFEYRKKY